MRPEILFAALSLLAAAQAPVATAATSTNAQRAAQAETAPDRKNDPRRLENDLRFRGHPDLLYRSYGVDAYRRKNYDYALTLFKRAAWYGDKPSQGMIAEMYAAGRGVEADLALAYAWMDLAAERGYRDFVIHRERYWDRMDEAARRRAVEVGQPLYAEYGDDVAKPRFAAQLRRESKNVVGSRTGFAGNAKITVPSLFGEQTFSATDMQKVDFWDAEAYWKLQDRMWKNPNQKVRVSDLQEVRTQPPARPAPSAKDGRTP